MRLMSLLLMATVVCGLRRRRRLYSLTNPNKDGISQVPLYIEEEEEEKKGMENAGHLNSCACCYCCCFCCCSCPIEKGMRPLVRLGSFLYIFILITLMSSFLAKNFEIYILHVVHSLRRKCDGLICAQGSVFCLLSCWYV